ncbi:uncharacterized protein LOC122665917 [Telopea speciosissima]|uniref:uncharacterized protein LOC122665917 n=1 Tax=Telopea speciosissima TaxID=54955 RepID=UPI001CC6AB51|nr:uncharacterized protein LOC122665917 [Telopea speciosissima]
MGLTKDVDVDSQSDGTDDEWAHNSDNEWEEESEQEDGSSDEDDVEYEIEEDLSDDDLDGYDSKEFYGQFSNIDVNEDEGEGKVKLQLGQRIHASPIVDGVTYKIKSYESKHICERKQSIKHAIIRWVGKQIAPLIKADHEMKPSAINEFLLQKYHIQLPYQRLYRACRIAQEINEGSYARLPAYGGLVLEKNPGSKFIIEYESRQEHELDTVNPVFLRVFICFRACARRFLKGCRPFIGLDGCHLKGSYGGVLLSAISVDGNKGLFPIAYAVVEVECKESWLFFLNLLHDIIDPDDANRMLTFMSDKQKGLGDAIALVFPNAYIRYCSRHLNQNFKKKYLGDAFRKHFWTASSVCTVNQFESAMNDIRTMDNTAYE